MNLPEFLEVATVSPIGTVVAVVVLAVGVGVSVFVRRKKGGHDE